MHEVRPRGHGHRYDASEKVLHGVAYTSRLREARAPGRRLLIEIDLKTESKGDWTVVHIGGEIDLFTAPKLKEHIVDLVNDGKLKIAADLERVEFMDSTGLGVLVGALRRLKERDGTLALVAPQGPVLRVLDVTGLSKVFPIHESVSDATG